MYASERHISIGAALLFSIASAATLSAAAAQLPATEHQAEALEDVHRKQLERPETEHHMPASEHQEQVLRDFDMADRNRDGVLSRSEYAQMPATRHQARTIEGVQPKQLTRPETEHHMPASEHQEQVLRDFDMADRNRDGSLSEAEYTRFNKTRKPSM